MVDLPNVLAHDEAMRVAPLDTYIWPVILDTQCLTEPFKHVVEVGKRVVEFARNAQRRRLGEARKKRKKGFHRLGVCRRGRNHQLKITDASLYALARGSRAGACYDAAVRHRGPSLPNLAAQALAIRDLAKSYGERPVLSGVHLDVGAGEIVGLAGLNGAGKTTLFKSILDLTAIDGGSIAIFGEPHAHKQARANLMYLPERLRPPFYMRGAEFLRFCAGLGGFTADHAALRASAEAVELDPAALSQLTRSYSNGMLRKLGLAACWLSQKALIVLDEPAGGLDLPARAQLRRSLQSFREAGRSVLFSSHDLSEMSVLCDRVAILHRGSIVFFDSPAACLTTTGCPTLDAAFLRIVEGESVERI